MATFEAPTLREVFDGLPYERAPYILGGIAIEGGEVSGAIEALRELRKVNLEGHLRPPIPSVWERRASSTINAFEEDSESVDPAVAFVVLATIIDFGNVRYATDPALNEGKS